jgi:hypothetical protein
VVTLSAIAKESCPMPDVSVAGTGTRLGEPTTTVVRGTTVIDAVASNASSWMITAGRGLLA